MLCRADDAIRGMRDIAAAQKKRHNTMCDELTLETTLIIPYVLRFGEGQPAARRRLYRRNPDQGDISPTEASLRINQMAA